MKILLIIPGFIFAIIIMALYELRNMRRGGSNVHFYIKRGAYGSTSLYMGTPYNKCMILLASNTKLEKFFIKKDDYQGMKYGEIREITLNLED